MQKALAKSPMHNSYTKFNTTNGLQLAEREKELVLALALLASQLECMYTEMARALRSQKQHQEQVGVGQESREGKESEIKLGHGDAVSYGHSKANAYSGSQNQKNFDYLLKPSATLIGEKTLFEFSHQEYVSHSTIKI